MIVLLLGCALAIAIITITFLIAYARWNYGKLESLGIPVVKPYFIFGSDPLSYTKISNHQDLERYKKYGPVYGVYEGRMPRVYVCDPEMIRLILVKDFDCFYDRSTFPNADPLISQLLDFLPVEPWKVIRSQLTPMFTSGRIKHLGKVVQELMQEYAQDISKKMKEEQQDRIKFTMKDFMITFIVDSTAKSFLGVVLPDRKNPNNYLVKLIKQIMFEEEQPNFLVSVVETFPFVEKVFPAFKVQGLDTFVSTIEKIISARRKSGNEDSDFIQILINMLDKVDTPEYKKLKITKNTIYAQALEFFIAGYDSMGSTMNILSYYLATNPEVQDALIQEIDNLIENSKSGQLDHDALENAVLLTACITEAVRLSPAFPRPERICTKDWTYKGMTIKKGTSVMIPSWAANRNPDIFKNPESFDPQRFMPENKKDINVYAMTSFGFGPRNCIGQRLAYETLKMVTATFLKDFRFEAREDTEAKLIFGWSFVTRYAPIHVDLVMRH